MDSIEAKRECFRDLTELTKSLVEKISQDNFQRRVLASVIQMAKKVLLPQEESADETRQALALAQSQRAEVYMQIHKQMLDIYPATHGKMANGGEALAIIEGLLRLRLE